MKMSKLLAVFAIVFMLALSAVAQVATGTKATLAISSIKATPALLEDCTSTSKMSLKRLADSMDAQLIESVNSTKKFKIVGRNDDDVAAVLAEQNWGDSGNLKKETAAKIGEMTGASYLLVATVDDYQDRTRTLKVDNERSQTLREIRISVVAKVYNSTTGELLEAVSLQESENTSRNSNSAVLADEGTNTDKMLSSIARNLAKQIATVVCDRIYPAKVVAVSDNGIVTINRGEGTGIKKGQVWTIFGIGEEMTDPDTGESLGVQEIPLCEAKVLVVTAKTTSLKLLEEDPGVEKGMIVRMVTAKD